VESGVGWAPTKALLDQLARSAAADPALTRLVHIGEDGSPYDPDWARIHDQSPWLSTVLAHSPDEVAGCLPPAVHPAHLDSYVCGSPAVVASASTALAAVGVPAGHILSTSWPGA
jgi:NAD(P)H-flavin reductase